MLKTPTGFAAALPLVAATFLCPSTAFAQDPADMTAAERRELEAEARRLGDDVVDRADDLADEAERVADGNDRDAYVTRDPRHFVHPITAHNYSEDALITTDIRGTYINHQFSDDPVFSGGAFRGYDFQVRHKLNERFQVMVSKFGFADVHLGGNHAADLGDLALGLKYALVQDRENAHHFAVGAGYELGIGEDDTFGGDDEIRLFAAWTKGFDRLNLSASANVLFATGDENVNGDSDRLSAHLHADYRLDEIFSPVVELNYYQVLSDSDDPTLVPLISGIDLANFGGNEGENVLSAAIGGEFRIRPNLGLRLAYETPLTDNEDLFGYRWTASAVWSH